MATTGADIVSGARAETLHDSDTQVTDTQLYQQLGLEHQRLRRWLIQIAPELCRVVSPDIVISSGASFAKSAVTPAAGYQLEKIQKIERKLGSTWYPIGTTDDLNFGDPDDWIWCYPTTVWGEFPTTIEIRPTANAAGTYRVTYLAGVTVAMVAGTAIALPDGMELILQHRLAAWIRQRMDESPAWHEKQADEVLKDFRINLRARGGVAPKQGMARAFRGGGC